MSSLAARVLRTIRRHELLPGGTRVVVGVSGGSDSVALVHLLLELQAAGGFHVTGLVHVHHGLRGASADRDEEFCRHLSAALSLPAYVERVDVRDRARQDRRSLEDAGRVVRAEVLTRGAAALRSDRIAVGHTRDDQAETVLLKLFRGAGPRGLAGIHPIVGPTVRPLLGVGRDDLRRWLGERGLPYVEDETNADLCFRRNAVRHGVVPAIRGHFGAAAIEAMARHAEVAREDEALLGSLVQPLVERLVRADDSSVAVDPGELTGLPIALGRRVAMAALRLAGVREPGFEHATAVLALASGEVGIIQLPGGIHGHRTGGIVRFRAARPPMPACVFRYGLRVPGTVWVPEAGRLVGAETVADPSAALGRLAACGSSTAVIRADGLGPELFVRNWTSGDALRPLGLGGRKKLQDLFVDRKVPRAARPRVPLVVDGKDRIVWVPGHAIDEAYRVTSDTRAVVVLTVSESGGRE